MDDFESAFEEGSLVGGESVQKPVAEAPAPAPAPAPVAAANDGTPPKQDGAALEAPAPAPAPADVDQDDPAKLKQKISTLQGMLSKASEETKAERAARIAAEERAKQTETQPPAPAPAPAVDDEEEELLAELEQTSPMLAKGIRALMKRERVSLETALAEKYGKSIEEVREQVKPIQEKAVKDAEREHYATIDTAHPGWQEVVAAQSFQDWVKAQPAYVRKELVRVSQEGTATEVIEVLDSYRKANPATQSTGGDATTNGNETANSRREMQRQAMSTVPTRPVPMSTAGANKTDFDAGFEAAAAATQ